MPNPGAIKSFHKGIRSDHRYPPGPHTLSSTKNLHAMRRQPLEFLLNMQQYGDIVYLHLGFSPTYILYHPDAIRWVLLENKRNYSKDVYDYRLFVPFLGQGLVTNAGESWLQQRRLMQPAFHRQRISALADSMAMSTWHMLERWNDSAQNGQLVDIAQEMRQLVLCILGQGLFHIDLNDSTISLSKAVQTLTTLMDDYLQHPLFPLSIPTTRNRCLNAALHHFDRLIFDLLHERRQQDFDHGDLLSMMLQTQDKETGQGMNDQQLRDELLTLIVAGHETTTSALVWTWYLLSQHPIISMRLRTELDQVLKGKSPDIEQLAALTYNRQIIEEAMRLYPPAWLFSRCTVADDEIAGYSIRAGSTILVSPYATHRHPDFWSDQEAFDPERFDSTNPTRHPHFAYFPFGGGPRQCIGNTFALMATQIVLAIAAQYFQWELRPDTKIVPQANVTLHPRHGLPMFLRFT